MNADLRSKSPRKILADLMREAECQILSKLTCCFMCELEWPPPIEPATC